jgi:hypothetical protein
VPISKHYGGHGAKVMKDMQQKYGSKKGKEIFYATENKMKKTPKLKKPKGGENPFFGNSLPFQLGDPKGRFIADSRPMGKMSFKKGK